MLFNPDPIEQAVEVTFSRKTILADHPPILFNDFPVIKVNEHKYLSIILDSKLPFDSHIQSVILKCRRRIGMIKILCHSYDRPRSDVLRSVYAILLPRGFSSLAYELLLKIILYGDQRLTTPLNRKLLEASKSRTLVHIFLST